MKARRFRTVCYRTAVVGAGVALLACALPEGREWLAGHGWLPATGVAGLLVIGRAVRSGCGELGREEIPADEAATIESIGVLAAGERRPRWRASGGEPGAPAGTVVEAVFRVNERFDLPRAYRRAFGEVGEADLRVGILAEPGRCFDATLTVVPSGAWPMSGVLPSSRCLALRLSEVGGGICDFLMSEEAVLSVGTPAELLRLLAARTYFGPGLLALVAYAPAAPEGALRAAWRRRARGDPLTQPWYSGTPFLLGRWSADHRLLAGVRGRPRAVRYSLMPRSTQRAAGFDFCVQLQTSAGEQPVEDAAVAWSEWRAPWIPVAQVELRSPLVRAGLAGTPLTFNRWRCPVEHRPLGGLNRVDREFFGRWSGGDAAA